MAVLERLRPLRGRYSIDIISGGVASLNPWRELEPLRGSAILPATCV